MLLFRSKEHAVSWAKASALAVGDILAVEQVWELSKLWYGDRLRRDFNGRSKEEANAIFAKLNLPAPFWRFP